MCDDERALLRTICETPDCDVPRLVYADWLEERGRGGLANYIRTSIAVYQTEPWSSFGYDGNLARMFGVDPTYWDSSDTHRAFRGFVSEIRCTLAEFVGGECWACGGSGRMSAPIMGVTGKIRYQYTPCNHCDGTGAIPGLARTLFEVHPITSVVLTDVAPWQVSDGVGRWGWSDHPDDLILPGNRSVVPAELFGLLPDTESPNRRFRHRRWYTTRDAALAALSLACVNYARSLHELPLLTKEQVTA